VDSVLFALTIVSVVAAGACGAFAWRLLREDRRRSDARVAALSAAIDAGEPYEPHAAPAPVSVSELFNPQHSASARGNPMIKVAVGVVMGLVLIVAIAMSGRGPGGGGEQAAAASGGRPLELISMRHTRAGDTLTVSGLVRNPSNAGRVERVTAVVFAFDRAGTFVASGRAPLDFVTLDAGDESPFVVSIAAVSEVGRYRVTFRTESGVVRHVDRRADQTRLAAAVR
jgi:hypothetical protein